MMYTGSLKLNLMTHTQEEISAYSYIWVASLSSLSKLQSFSASASAFPVTATSLLVSSRSTPTNSSKQDEKFRLLRSSHSHKFSLLYSFFQYGKYSKNILSHTSIYFKVFFIWSFFINFICTKINVTLSAFTLRWKIFINFAAISKPTIICNYIPS